MGGVCSTCEQQEGCIQGFGGKPEGSDHVKDLGVDKRIILKWILKRWAGLVCFKIVKNGRLFLKRQRSFGFHKMQVFFN
jgi:hypothetical protein